MEQKMEDTVRENRMRRDLGVMWRFLAPKYLFERAQNKGMLGGTSLRATVLTRGILPEDERRVDAILLPGSNDSEPAKQAALFFGVYRGQFPGLKITAAGGEGPAVIPASTFSGPAALEYAKILQNLDVPGENILAEPSGSTTAENISLAEKILNSSGLFPRNFLIIQSHSAQLRTNMIFEKQWKGEWDRYLSFPPPAPNLNGLSFGSLRFYLDNALREAFSIMNFIYDPRFGSNTNRELPNKMLAVMHKYRGPFDFKPTEELPCTPDGFDRFFDECPRRRKQDILDNIN